MIRDYKIIMAETLEELEKSVRTALSEGWQPQGGVALVLIYDPQVGAGRLFAQAMIVQ